MKRYVGIVESINWDTNLANVRVPSRDGFSDTSEYQITDLLNRVVIQTQTDDLQEAAIPRHLQGIRVGDVVLCADPECLNSNMIMKLDYLE